MPKPPSLGAATSPFGMRTHPVTGVYRMHYGEDTVGDGNYAPVTGTVAFAGYDTTGHGFGNVVGIREDANPSRIWWVAHHRSLAVRVGDRVGERSSRTGPLGMTGAATGPHAHTECRIGGTAHPGSGTAVNPRSFYTTTAGGGESAFIPPKESTMYLARAVDNGNVFLITDNGRALIQNPYHLELLQRLLRKSPGEVENFNSAEVDIITAYVAAANSADAADTAKILTALSEITFDPAPIVRAVQDALAVQSIEVDFTAIEGAIEAGFAAVNANIDDQPTEFTIKPKA